MAGGYQHRPIATSGTQALAAVLRDLQRQIDDQRKALAGLGIQIDPDGNLIFNTATGKLLIQGAGGAEVNGGGGIVISNDGALTVVDADGRTVAVIGGLPPDFNRPDGSTQPGLAFYREDGSLAAVLGDLDASVAPFRQAWQVLDRAGNTVLADDTNGGKGLANPWLGGGLHMVDSDITRWPQTTNSTFTLISYGWYTVQNPRVQWDIEGVADVGTTGEYRLMVGGTQVGATQTITDSFTDWSQYGVALPAGIEIGTSAMVSLEARRTAGTGAVYASIERWMGDQSP